MSMYESTLLFAWEKSLRSMRKPDSENGGFL
jgi:hypothetical protein